MRLKNIHALDTVFLKPTNFCLYRNNENNRQYPKGDLQAVSIVLFDGRKRACRQCLQQLQQWDSMQRLVLLDVQGPLFRTEHWGVKARAASQTVHVLTADNSWLCGSMAFDHILQQLCMTAEQRQQIRGECLQILLGNAMQTGEA